MPSEPAQDGAARGGGQHRGPEVKTRVLEGIDGDWIGNDMAWGGARQGYGWWACEGGSLTHTTHLGQVARHLLRRPLEKRQQRQHLGRWMYEGEITGVRGRDGVRRGTGRAQGVGSHTRVRAGAGQGWAVREEGCGEGCGEGRGEGCGEGRGEGCREGRGEGCGEGRREGRGEGRRAGRGGGGRAPPSRWPWPHRTPSPPPAAARAWRR